MADTGWVITTVAAVDLDDIDDQAWVNPGNVTASDDSKASWTVNFKSGGTTDTLKVYTFGLSVPAGATIDGIEVRVEARRWGTSGDISSVNVYDGDSTAGTAKNPGTAMTGTDANYDYGAADDMWGLTLSASDVNDAGFQSRFKFSGISLNDAVEVDAAWIKVYYTAAAGAGLALSSLHRNQIKHILNR